MQRNLALDTEGYPEVKIMDKRHEQAKALQATLHELVHKHGGRLVVMELAAMMDGKLRVGLAKALTFAAISEPDAKLQIVIG
jgi:uncharacterized protein (DUF1330 family)